MIGGGKPVELLVTYKTHGHLEVRKWLECFRTR